MMQLIRQFELKAEGLFSTGLSLLLLQPVAIIPVNASNIASLFIFFINM